MVYDKTDLQLDIDWLDGYNIDRKEAKSFIKNIIKDSGGELGRR